MVRPVRRITRAFLLILTVLAGSQACALSVHNGVLLKDGKPYHGMGINYFDAFSRLLANPVDTSTYGTGFNVLKQFNVPFIRFEACGFYPTDWALYQTDTIAYFALLDSVVRAAEKKGIGLFPSLFFRYATICNLVNEPLAAWGDTNSKTQAFMRTYVAEVVGRYKNSSAVWGWEFGNEFNLSVDLPNWQSWITNNPADPVHGISALTAADTLSSDTMTIAYAAFAKAVRALDSSHIIITGNAIPRPTEWHQAAAGKYQIDTKGEFQQMLARDNPGAVSVSCIHYYPYKGDSVTAGYGYVDYFDTASPATIPQLLSAAKAAADSVGRPLFIGEFGATLALGDSVEHAVYNQIFSAIRATNTPLSSAWVFDLSNQNTSENITATNSRAFILDSIKALNQYFQSTPVANQSRQSARCSMPFLSIAIKSSAAVRLNVSALGKQDHLELTVFDAAGRMVSDLTARIHEGVAIWNIQQVRNGVYAIRLKTGPVAVCRDIVVAR